MKIDALFKTRNVLLFWLYRIYFYYRIMYFTLIKFMNAFAIPSAGDVFR